MSQFSLEFAPDKTDYNRLPPADRALVDRAIFDNVVTHNARGFAFSNEERGRHGGQNPDSKQAEWDIWRLRDQQAERLLRGGAGVRQQLQREGQGAPQNATAMLNAINAFNGDECGCGGQGVPINLNSVLRGTGRGGR